MKCNEVRKYLEEFIKGDLAEKHTKLVAAHIKECHFCKKNMTY